MRLIDADDAVKKLQEYVTEMESDIYHGSNLGIPEGCICEAIEELPTIEAEPVKHGKWKHYPGINSKCSECGRYFPVDEFDSRPFDINYCPNCGAKMTKDIQNKKD